MRQGQVQVAIRVEEYRSEELVSALVGVWERSVRATHGFLDEDDLAEIAREVPGYVRGIERLVVAYQGVKPVAFAGTQGGMLEMLFVASECRGQGVGGLLLDDVLTHAGVTRVDVNEQNDQARGFYEHRGFTVTGRSETDSQGRPFPLLHLELQER